MARPAPPPSCESTAGQLFEAKHRPRRQDALSVAAQQARPDEIANRLLDAVALVEVLRCLAQFPHQLGDAELGGMALCAWGSRDGDVVIFRVIRTGP